MPLQQSLLKKELLKSFKEIQEMGDPGGPPPPLMAFKVAESLANAYHRWVSTSSPMAGPLTISVPGQPTLLASSLSSMPLMQGWGPGLLSYWTGVVWGNAPGFIPTNPTIAAPVLGVVPEIAILMVPPPKVESEDDFAEKFSTILSRYTKLIQVTATTVSGFPSVVPVQ